MYEDLGAVRQDPSSCCVELVLDFYDEANQGGCRRLLAGGRRAREGSGSIKCREWVKDDWGVLGGLCWFDPLQIVSGVDHLTMRQDAWVIVGTVDGHPAGVMVVSHRCCIGWV